MAPSGTAKLIRASLGKQQDKVPSVSVVIPVLNELARLPELIGELSELNFEQIVIVDGGSRDGSYAWLLENWCDTNQQCIALQTSTGRAIQMNKGALASSADYYLFLHSDCLLAPNALAEIAKANEFGKPWGRFDIGFRDTGKRAMAMQIIAFFINLRSRWSAIATGDQAIFVNRLLFEDSGGFPGLPLMEDVALSKKLKGYASPYCSRTLVITSARRWLAQGVIKTVLLMWALRFAYFVGVPSERLANFYRDVR